MIFKRNLFLMLYQESCCIIILITGFQSVEILFTKFVVPVTQLLMLVQNFVVMWKFYDGRKRRKLKECVSQRRNIDDFLCDTYYEEEDDE